MIEYNITKNGRSYRFKGKLIFSMNISTIGDTCNIYETNQSFVITGQGCPLQIITKKHLLEGETKKCLWWTYKTNPASYLWKIQTNEYNHQVAAVRHIIAQNSQNPKLAAQFNIIQEIP